MRAVESIFSLTVDGIVGRATWYTIVLLYTAVLKLGELQSLGQTFYGYSWEYPEQILPGEQGAKVTLFSAASAPISRGGSNYAKNSKVMEELGIEPFDPVPF